MSLTNLPLQLTSFIGREDESAALVQLLATSRLVTIKGAGGCGKTRLALEVTKSISEGFSDGVWMVELASLRDPALMPQLITQTLGIPRGSRQPAIDSLLNFLLAKEMLLVMDNCEHLITDCASLAQQILSHSPNSRILATSREALAVAGETVFPLSGLACPSVEVERIGDTPDLIQYGAVRLLVERVRSVQTHFIITTENASQVIKICQRLDGLPLALELASARSNVLSLEQIAERLDDRFSLLTSRLRGDQESRHQTLRGAMDWSYDLLTQPEQELFQRLSVFVGGCSLGTVEEVCLGDEIEPNQVLELLSSLVNKSLVLAQTLRPGEARYTMLETIRQYAQEKLIASEKWPSMRDRHLQCFVQLTEEAAQKLTGPYQQLWLSWLEGEYDNVRAAISWSLENGDVEAGLRIAIAIYTFWTIRDYVEEGLAWVERLLMQADERVTPAIRANAMAYAAFLAGFRGNISIQMKYGSEAAAIAEAAGDEGKPALKWALSAQAYGARAAGEYQTEFTLNERVIQLNRESGDQYQLGLTLSFTSFSAMALGKYDVARAMLDESLVLLREAGNPYRIAMALNFSGDLRRCEQEYAEAKVAYEESISLLRQLGAMRDLASVLHNQGHTCLHLGDIEHANALFGESMSIQQSQGNIPGIAECLIGFAAMAVALGSPAAGARLLAAAVEIGRQRIVTMWAATRMEYEQNLALIQRGMTEAEFQAEQAAGRALTIEQAVLYAQSLPLKATSAASARQKPDKLTEREREIAALIAQGNSNGEIAENMVLSKRTVEKHIAHIFLKLGVTNRAQIVRWAIETGLVKLPIYGSPHAD